MPQSPGRGVGKSLLLGLIEEAKRLGYRRVRLETGPDQPEALALYRSCRFVEIDDDNANPNAAHWMEKRVARRSPA